MRQVFIIGIGQTPVAEHWDTSLRHLAWQAIEPALDLAAVKKPDGVFVGNMLADQISNQQHLGALIPDFCGLHGVEGLRIEAAGASGGAALRMAYLAIQSGALNTALVVGVEKITDKVGAGVATAMATGTDSDWEASHGATTPAIAALIMQRYMHEHNVSLRDFAGFSVNAHANSVTNPNAFLRNVIRTEDFVRAPMVSSPVNLFDSAPNADGSAALVLAAGCAAPDSRPLVRIAASAVATDTLAIHDRSDPLVFKAAQCSVKRACEKAAITLTDLDVFELYDCFTVYTALSLEAAGYATRGEGWRLAQNGEITLRGKVPIATFGGLKARGNPGGATGVYQIAELVQQLLGDAGDNQVPTAHWGMAQCLGGSASTAITHILERM